MSRFNTPLSPITDVQFEMQRLYQRDLVGIDDPPPYLIGGDASFTPPKTNIVQNLFAKSAENSFTGIGSVLNSGFGFVSQRAFTKPDLDLPIEDVDGKVVMADGKLGDLNSLTGSAIFDAFSPNVRSLLQVNGYDRSNFSDTKTLEDAEERFENISFQISLRQKIVRYNEVHPHYATATGALGFALDAITDPVNLVSFGIGGVFKGAATSATKATVKSLAKSAGKSYVDDGFRAAAHTVTNTVRTEGLDILPAFVKNAREGDRLSAHLMASASAGSQALGFDAVAQYSLYRNRVENLGHTDDFAYNFYSAGVSLTLGLGLANLGAIQWTKGPKATLDSDVLASAPRSLAAEKIRNRNQSNLTNLGSLADDRRKALGLPEDTVITDNRTSFIKLDAAHRVEKWSGDSYSPTQAAEIQDLYANLISLSDDEEALVGRFFSSVPTFKEAKRFLTPNPTTGAILDPNFQNLFTRLQSQVTKAGREIRTLRAKPNKTPQEVRDLSRMVRSQNRRIASKQEIVDSFVFKKEEITPNAPHPIIRDEPLLDIYDRESDRISRVGDLLTLKPQDIPGHNPGQIRRLTSSVFRHLEKIGTFGTLVKPLRRIEAIENSPLASTTARMIAAFDHRIANNHFTKSDGTGVVSFIENMTALRSKGSEFRSLYARATKKMSTDDISKLGDELFQVRSGVKAKFEVSKIAGELSESYGKYYDSIGSQGVENGALRNLIKGYAHVVLKKDLSGDQIETIAAKLAVHWQTKSFAKSTNKGSGRQDAVLHRGTLFDMRLVDDSGNLIEPRGGDAVPTRWSDLTPEEKVTYDATLPDSLLNEARHAVERRRGRHSGSAEDPVVSAEARDVKYREDNRASRQIEQDFWAKSDVLEFVDTDAINMMNTYETGFGAVIARQETLTEVFGEAVRFDDLVKVLTRRAEALEPDDLTRQPILDGIEALETINNRALGHIKRNKTGLEPILQPLTDLAAGAINQGIAIPMQTEMMLSLLPRLIHPSEIGVLMKHMRNIFDGGMNRDEMLAFGYGWELEHDVGRFLGTAAFDPVGSIGQSARWYRNKSRKFGGEAFLTQRLKRLNFVVSYGATSRKLTRVVDKLDALGRATDINDPSLAKQAARDAGFGGDVALANDIRRLGLHTKESQRALKKFKEAGSETLLHPETAMKVALRESDPGLRTDMMNLVDNLSRFSRDKTDRIIVTRSIGTALSDTDVLGASLLQFLTYPTSWFNSFLKRESDSPFRIYAGYLGAYSLGEMMAGMTRDVVIKGQTPEETLLDWEENWPKKAALLASRIPVAGALTDIVVGSLARLATDQPLNLEKSIPSVSFANQTISGGIALAKDIVNDGEPSQRSIQRTIRFSPFVGHPGSMIMLNQLVDE